MNQQQDPYQPPGNASSRRIPNTELEYNLRLTDPVYGTSDINGHIKDKLERYFYVRDKDGNVLIDENGQPIVNRESMWEKLNFYTRDMRLGNLDKNEMEYCQWYLDFCSDCLQDNMVQSFVVSLSRAATIIELSQSKKGFLRKQPNTLTTENRYMEMEPTKKSLFGKKQQ